MARALSITSPPDKTDIVLRALQLVPEVIELQVFRTASVSPPGDVIKLIVPNAHLNQTMRLLDGFALGEKNGISVSTSEVAGIIPTGSAHTLERDNNEAAWEEVELTIGNDSNSTPNTLFSMFVSGGLAAAGIATNALHIVVAAMLIAPGFMPISRVALEIVGRRSSWIYGVIDFVKGYLALIAGAITLTLVLNAMGYEPLFGKQSYYVINQSLTDYWTTISAVSVLTSLLASIAGGLLLASRKSVLTSGVMIGLALVPSAALIGMSLVEAQFLLAQKALLRFSVEVILVLLLSLLVFFCTRIYIHKRDSKL